MEGDKSPIFINFTNHPSDCWEERQKVEALRYGEVVDLPFPQVDAKMGTQEVADLAENYVKQIIGMKPMAVLCQGEFCVTYQVVKLLIEQGITVLAACSTRETTEIIRDDGSTEKIAVFKFVQFREYT